MNIPTAEPRPAHRHWCDVSGHEYQCDGDCVCICGLPMTGNDHGRCPVEMRPCPEHAAEAERHMAEANARNAEFEAEFERLRAEYEAAEQAGSPDAEAKGFAMLQFVFGENQPEEQ